MTTLNSPSTLSPDSPRAHACAPSQGNAQPAPAPAGAAVLPDAGGDAASPLDLLSHAVALHMSGQADQAAAIYEAVLEDDPIQPTALHYHGIYLFQAGQQEQGLDKLMLASALAPEDPGWHNDLGNVLFAMGRYDQAEQSYQGALEFAGGDHTLWNNLGAAQLQQQKTAEAMASFMRATDIAPDFVPALQHLGALYEAAGDKMMSSHYQCRAYVLPPLAGKSREMLGVSYYFLGRLPEAAQVYRDWLVEEPEHPVAEHMLAACSQSGVPPRASDRYLEFHFDRYADTFDTNLIQNLAYRGPQLVGEGLQLIGAPARQFDVIDLGCGTGLGAPVMAPWARSLTGVDLAGKMLDKARALGLYDTLEKAEAVEYLTRHPQSADLLIAADTLIYFGALNALIAKSAAALRKGGYLLFTAELMTPQDMAPAGFTLHASGRYRHDRAYVKRLLQQHGMTLLHDIDVVLREELRQSVAGVMYLAQRR